MFREEIAAISACAATKVKLLKTNPAGYFLMSIFGGVFIGLGFSQETMWYWLPGY